MIALQRHPCPSSGSGFLRHDFFVYSVAFSPDGKLLASSSHGPEKTSYNINFGTVRLWDLGTRQERATLMQRRGWIRAVAFSPDGQTLAVGISQDKTVRLMNVDREEKTPGRLGKQRAVLKGHTRPVVSLAFSPDGKRLASGAADKAGVHAGGEAKLWDMATNQELFTLALPRGAGCLAYSPDGSMVALGCQEGSIHLCNAATAKFRQPSLEQQHVVRALAFSPDGKTLASAAGQLVKLWDPATGKHRADLKGHKQFIPCLAYSPSGRTLASGSADGNVCFWDPATGRERAAFDWQLGHLQALAFAPDGMTAAAAGNGANVLVLWDVDEGQ
jgi:WD40 repeat protein